VNLIVDTNIIISGLITPQGTIAELIFNKLDKSILVSPRFMLDELQDKFDKILRITKYSNQYLTDLIYLIHKKIDFINGLRQKGFGSIISTNELVKRLEL
jgi:predicted nucleic acid-binding protein